MKIQGYFTGKGLILSSKLASGDVLTITRVLAGSGQTANPAKAIALSQVKQTLAVNTPVHNGNTAVIPATLAAAHASANYTLTELGVYAKDPDEGEILYKVYRLDTPVEVVSGSAMVLRFYLEETVSEAANVTVLCSPAGLITETDFAPVKNVVHKTNAPARSVTISASELPAYIASLPRLLTDALTINVSGELTEKLRISDLYGSGQLTIKADALGTAVLGMTQVVQCRVAVQFCNIAFQEPTEGFGNAEAAVHNSASVVYLQSCSITGQYSTAGGNSGFGVSVADSGVTYTHELKVSNSKIALRASYGAVLSCYSSDASSFSDNYYGAQVYRGGTILLSGATPNTVGGVANIKDGGLIVSAAGTLL